MFMIMFMDLMGIGLLMENKYPFLNGILDSTISCTKDFKCNHFKSFKMILCIQNRFA